MPRRRKLRKPPYFFEPAADFFERIEREGKIRTDKAWRDEFISRINILAEVGRNIREDLDSGAVSYGKGRAPDLMAEAFGKWLIKFYRNAGGQPGGSWGKGALSNTLSGPFYNYVAVAFEAAPPWARSKSVKAQQERIKRILRQQRTFHNKRSVSQKRIIPPPTSESDCDTSLGITAKEMPDESNC